MFRRAVSQLVRVAGVTGRANNCAVVSTTANTTVMAAVGVQQGWLGHASLTNTMVRPYSTNDEDYAQNFDIPYYYEPADAFVGRPAPHFKGKGMSRL